MITKRHTVEIIVNGESLEFESQNKVNLRINNNVYNPEKLTVTQSEYSFSFNVPATPNNNRIFGFANIPSVKGKFVKQFDCHVYADGVEIFQGVLRINSVTGESYKCNLVSIKNSSVDEIFGESKMSDVKWEVPFQIDYNKPFAEVDTINMVNKEDNPDYFFPLVCYGAFQKDPYFSVKDNDTSIEYYTSTNKLDKWVKYYPETFVPSPNLIALIRKMIEQKGYTCSGNVFTDELIKKLYLSNYIPSDYDPPYNWGGERGKIKVDFDYTQNSSTGVGVFTNAYNTDLKYPTDYHMWDEYGKKRDDLGDEIAWVNKVFEDNGLLNLKADNVDMWVKNNIYIPHSGYYKIKMDATMVLFTTLGQAFFDSYPEIQDGELMHIPYQRNFNLDELPFELQLVKNPDPLQELEFSSTNKTNYIAQAGNRYSMFYTDYPHEAIGGAYNNNGKFDSDHVEYYFQQAGKTRGYDPYVSDKVVMGMNTINKGWSIQKRGRSWDKTISDDVRNNYQCGGYSKYTKMGTTEYIDHNTEYQAYDDADIPACTYNRLSDVQVSGTGYAVVWLEKGDMLDVRMLSKRFRRWVNNHDTDSYWTYVPGTRVYGSVTVEAWSPKKKDLKKSWNGETAYGKDLNIGNFLNSEETQKDFFNNFLTTFNLSCNIEGNNIDINTNANTLNINDEVDMDDRVNVREIETGVIDFPTSVEVKWTIDEEESGFYHSVPDDNINDDDWKNYADRGSEKVRFIDNVYSKNEISKTSKFSYNWMMDFILTDYWFKDIDGVMRPAADSKPLNVRLPIVAKDENFIDGANYEDMMKKDGRSLKQRLWFKSPAADNVFLPTRKGAWFVYDIINPTLCIKLCTPTNLYEGKDVLKYTSDKDSLLMRYFNVNQETESNYATIEAYITPQEYMRLKNGAMVRVDNDRYRICSISGYDPSGNNKVRIKMMKL